MGVKSAAAIITPSNAVKKDVSDYYKVSEDKIHVTYEGVSYGFENKVGDKGELEVLSNHGLKSEEYFFYVGNAYPHKNLDLAVKAIIVLNNELETKIKFAVAGSKDIFIKRLQTLVDKEGAQEFVKILGYVPDEELQIIYKNSISFVYPSLSEGFGLQGLEAIASGSLVLVSDIPEFREIYQNNVLYFNPKEVNSLVKTMKDVMKTPHIERSSMINRAREFIKKYSWQKMAGETLEVYRHVL